MGTWLVSYVRSTILTLVSFSNSSLQEIRLFTPRQVKLTLIWHIKASAIMLATQSPLLRRLMEDSWVWQDSSAIFLPDFPCGTVQRCLDYMKTGNTGPISSQSELTGTQELLKYLGVSSLSTLSFSIKQLTPINSTTITVESDTNLGTNKDNRSCSISMDDPF